MSIRNAFKTYLLTKTDFTDLVGASGNARVFPGFLPQGTTLPAVVLNIISDVPDHDTQGANGWTVARLQVDCYGLTPDAADAVSEQIRLACDGYTGLMGATEVAWCFHEEGDDVPEIEPENEERRRQRRHDDYRLAYFKTLPTL